MTETAVADPRPVAAVLASAVAVVLIVASARRPNVREGWSVLAAFVKFGLIASMLPGVLDGTEYRWSLGMVPGLREEFVFGIELALRVDSLGMLFGLLASFLWIFTAFYSMGYMRGLGEPNQTRFFAAFAASLSTAVGIAFAENLIVMFLFYELLSIVTYPLVAHDETDEARAAGRKYLAYTFFGGGFLVLGGSALVWWLTGQGGESTLTFGETAEPLEQALESGAVGEPFLILAFAMLALGFGTKAAIMPLHSWLPDAMVAPTPVSGLLHAVAVVKAGAFGVSRVVLDVYEPSLTAQLNMHVALATLATVSFLLASFIALRKDNLKRRLAYSTASQLSYIIMGVALLAPMGVTGGLLHIPAHAFMKLTLFFCAGAIHVETHTDDISEMAGIGKRMPLTMGAFAVAAAGMAGIPLIAGFVSKFYMLVGAIRMTDSATAVGDPTAAGFVFGAGLVFSGILNIVYFWPVVYTAFFESEDAHDAKPLVEFPVGGEDSTYGVLGGGDAEPRADGGHQNESDDTHSDGSTDREGDDERGAASEHVHGGDEDDDPTDEDHVHGGDEDDDTTDEDHVHGGDEDDDPTDEDHVHGGDDGEHHQLGGAPPGGWDRRALGRESTKLMLVPILVIVTGAVVLGVVPAEVGFLELARDVAAAATDLEVGI